MFIEYTFQDLSSWKASPRFIVSEIYISSFTLKLRYKKLEITLNTINFIN